MWHHMSQVRAAPGLGSGVGCEGGGVDGGGVAFSISRAHRIIRGNARQGELLSAMAAVSWKIAAD